MLTYRKPWAKAALTIRYCLFLLIVASRSSADEPKAPLPKVTLTQGDTIVFLGDSITQQCLYTQYVEDYFYTRMPHTRLKFHNAGVGGDKVGDALARFERDVAAYKPKYVTVLLGMNDGSYKPFDQEIFQTYHDGMLALVDKIVSIGATPILITPTMYDARAARAKVAPTDPERLEFYDAVLAYYGAWGREIATQRGLGFSDMYSPLNNLTLHERKKDPKYTLIPDAVHPAAGGQAVMASALISDLGLPTRVATLSISKGDGDQAIVQAMGGKVTDAKFNSDGLEFAFLADGLPFILPEDAKAGYDLAKIGHRLSRDAIEIHGLASGKYQLFVGPNGSADRLIGTFKSQDLEDSIELQGNAKMPNHEQATAIAELNARRNAEAVQPLRMLWRSKKLLSRSREQLEQSPESTKVQAEVAKLEKELEDFEGQIKNLEAAATKIEDQIYRANQPKPLRYRLVRAGS